MDEEPENKKDNLEKDEVQETIPEATVKESNQETEDLISKANAAASRIEAANKRQEELISKAEKIAVEQTLSGKASAGTKRRSKDEIEVANARKFLAGTGYEDDLFPETK